MLPAAVVRRLVIAALLALEAVEALAAERVAHGFRDAHVPDLMVVDRTAEVFGTLVVGLRHVPIASSAARNSVTASSKGSARVTPATAMDAASVRPRAW